MLCIQAFSIQIGTDVLNDDESQKLTALLYSYRDVFASDYNCKEFGNGLGLPQRPTPHQHRYH